MRTMANQRRLDFSCDCCISPRPEPTCQPCRAVPRAHSFRGNMCPGSLHQYQHCPPPAVVIKDTPCLQTDRPGTDMDSGGPSSWTTRPGCMTLIDSCDADDKLNNEQSGRSWRASRHLPHFMLGGRRSRNVLEAWTSGGRGPFFSPLTCVGDDSATLKPSQPPLPGQHGRAVRVWCFVRAGSCRRASSDQTLDLTRLDSTRLDSTLPLARGKCGVTTQPTHRPAA